MSLFLLDADTAIYALRRVRAVREAIRAREPSEVAISSLVYSQLLQGATTATEPAAELQRVKVFVGDLVFKPYDRAAADCYGEIVAAIGFNRRDAIDRMIAAHAISLDATLVTNNLKDFAGIPGLRVVNWADP